MTTSLLRRAASGIVPASARRSLRDAHREWTFARALRRFTIAPELHASPDSQVLRDLAYGWGNAGWRAQAEFLSACVKHALTTRGSTLECGTGLTTVLLGAIAQLQGRRHWALEHSPFWALRIRRYLDRFAIDSVTVATGGLRDFGDYCWYDTSKAAFDGCGFSLVVCDGPPGDTKGGRYGLVPRMGHQLRKGCVILLDDMERPAEQSVAERWSAELDSPVEIIQCAKPYARLVVDPENVCETSPSTWVSSSDDLSRPLWSGRPLRA